MKAHRFKTKLTDRQNVHDEFYGELNRRYELHTKQATTGQGVLPYMQYCNTEEGKKALATIKLTLIKEWESKGRNMQFLNREDNFMDLLQLKHFGKTF